MKQVDFRSLVYTSTEKESGPQIVTSTEIRPSHEPSWPELGIDISFLAKW